MDNPNRFRALAIGANEAYPDGKTQLDEDGNLTLLTGIIDAGDIVAASVAATTLNGAATTETSIFSGELPAGRYRVGSLINLTAVINATGFHSTDTLTLKIKLAGVTLVTAVLEAADEGYVPVLFNGIVQVLGASGKMLVGDATITGTENSGLMPPEIIDVNFSVENTLQLTAEWSVADAGNTATLLGGVIKIS